GNTRFKLALFEEDTLKEIRFFQEKELLFTFLKKDDIVALSSVLENDFLSELEEKVGFVFQIHNDLKLPFLNVYETPNTLGIDRLCNAAAISTQFIGQNRLCIDLGTCIKFDFLNAQNEFVGGSISPGLLMRYKALNTFTARLPLLQPAKHIELIGKNTEESLQTGVQLGMRAEIEGMMELYKEQYQDLKIFVTGGDAHYFDFEQKNSIFADDNLTLKGIFELYKLNATHA
ncbi:MAG: type III pantothenate kinase, partial [Crocinitomicaceae bacterium]|nr:type III pantothenate kinase [Crocinitomicaceae bacterium]